jgi:hypothetical protein
MPKRVITMVKAPTPHALAVSKAHALAVSKPPAKPLAVANKYVSELVGAGKPFSKLGTGLGYKLTKNYTVLPNTNLIIGKSGSNNGNGNIVINGGFTITISSGSSITFKSNATLDQRQFLNCKIIGLSTTKKGALKETGTILNGTTGIVSQSTVTKSTGVKINTALKQTYLSDAAYKDYITDRGLNNSGTSGYALKKSWTLPLNTNVTIGYVSTTNNKNGGELLFLLNNSAPMYYTITVPTSSSITFLPNVLDLTKAGAMNLYLYGGKLVKNGKLRGTGTILARNENQVVGSGNKDSTIEIVVEGSAPML